MGRQGREQGVATRHQARPSREGGQDHQAGGDLHLRPAHQGVRDHRSLHWLNPQGRVLKIKPVEKQTRAGQRTRFKAIVAVGDENGHVGLGVKCSKEVATAIRGAIILAKLSVVPIRRGYWGNKLGQPHTVPGKVHGKCGSVHVRLIPAPRGTGLVCGPVPKKLMQMAGLEDVYTSACGGTATLGNFAKATFQAICRTNDFLTPELWKEEALLPPPFEAHSEYLQKNHKIGGVQRGEVKNY